MGAGMSLPLTAWLSVMHGLFSSRRKSKNTKTVFSTKHISVDGPKAMVVPHCIYSTPRATTLKESPSIQRFVEHRISADRMLERTVIDLSPVVQAKARIRVHGISVTRRSLNWSAYRGSGAAADTSSAWMSALDMYVATVHGLHDRMRVSAHGDRLRVFFSAVSHVA